MSDSEVPTPGSPKGPTRDSLKDLGAAAIAVGSLFVDLPDLSRAPSTSMGPAGDRPGLRRPPFPGPTPDTVLDAEWCLVARGAYLSHFEFRQRLRDGPLPFAWLGTQDGPGLFQPGPTLTLGEARAMPDGSIRAASLSCVADRSPLRFDPSLDRWSCTTCGSQFGGKDGRVLQTPAPKPLLTFFPHVPRDGRRMALVPLNGRAPT